MTIQQQSIPFEKVKKNSKKAKNPYHKPRSGDVIDERFRIVGRPLGKGGMGTVYRIQDEAGVMHALKRLDPALREEKRFEKRFLLEYEATANLKHPNITAYHELFEANGALHIRMELVDGINLRQLLKREKRLPVPIALGISRALARALEHLHAHRVVHRDIKPENILLGKDGSIKVTDFGISRLEYAGITRTGTILGTPRYMSPEQLAGKKGEEIGPESDLYSLGVVMYEMLVGKDPYRLRQKAEVLEVINTKHNKDPKPLPKEFDEEIRQLVLSLLERDPANRPSNAKKIGQLLGKKAASRKELRHTIGEWATEYGSHQPAPKLSSPKRKRESFWETPKHSEAPEAPDSLPPHELHGTELLPAFLATILFLVFLWGLGFWQQKREQSQEPSAVLTRTEPTNSSSVLRQNQQKIKALQENDSYAQRKRKRKRYKRKKRKTRSKRRTYRRKRHRRYKKKRRRYKRHRRRRIRRKRRIHRRRRGFRRHRTRRRRKRR